MSDHRFEQRGLLHAEVVVHDRAVHVVVVHLGLIKASRVRQLAQLVRFIEREIPRAAPVIVAGDFNDWGATVGSALGAAGLVTFESDRMATFPSRLPVVQLDHVYARGMQPLGATVPRGRIWGRMSDHLPLIAEFELTGKSC
jgi:endonuclease/exonuclease/phosphatase family metal-dependent hydrolase